jgi:ankyrin repeat protein
MLQVHAVLQATTIRRRGEALDTLPSSLGDAFAGMMARIEQQPHALSEQAKKIIAWVHLAERPVTVDELLCSLAIEDGDRAFNPRGMPVRGTLINCCHGLVVIDQETYTVRLVHYSLEEYLTQQDRLFGLSTVQWHSQIALTCLTALRFPSTTAEHRCINDTFIPYAATKWGHHLRRSEHLPDTSLELAKEYLSSPSTQIRASLRLLYEDMYRYLSGRPREVLPTHIVAFFGINRIMLWLILSKYNLDIKDIAGQTPLSWAAVSGHITVVKLLIGHGAAINSRNIYNKTPLLLSLENRHEAVATLLVNEGATVGLEDDSGNTPLSFATVNGYDSVVRLLLEKGASVDPVDEMRRTPLAWAASNGWHAVAKLLVEKGAGLNSKDRYGRTPLILAASQGHEAVARLLLDSGAVVDTIDQKYGRTPLLWAAAEGDEAISKLLIENGAEVDSVDATNGRTTLLWAAYHGQEAIVRLLLDKGAAINVVEAAYGRTPLLLALEYGHKAIVKLLINRGAQVNFACNSEAVVTWDETKGLEALMDLLGFTADHTGHRARRDPEYASSYMEYFA